MTAAGRRRAGAIRSDSAQAAASEGSPIRQTPGRRGPAAAALVAAARLEEKVGAVVSRGGRPDLAGAALAEVRAPTLLIVGGDDEGVIELNERALARLAGPKALWIVPRASHLFPEPGALEAVIDQAKSWFSRHLPDRSSQ